MVERVRLVNGGGRPCISPIEETVAPVSTKNRIRSPATERHRYGSFSFNEMCCFSLSGRPGVSYGVLGAPHTGYIAAPSGSGAAICGVPGAGTI